MTHNTFLIDTQKKILKLTSAQKEALEQCQTIRYQQGETDASTISFSELNHSFLTKNKLRNLIKTIRNPLRSDDLPNKTLFSLLLAADYLEAPEHVRKYLGIEALGKLENKKLSDQEKEIKKCALHNCCTSLSGLIEKYYPQLLQVDQYNTIALLGAQYPWRESELYIENSKKLRIFSKIKLYLEKNEKKVYHFHSLTFPLFKKIKTLILTHQEIQDFSLTELVAGMPKLRYLNLKYNKIKSLGGTQLEGMPTKFSLYLNNNPIPLSGIDASYFTNDRFANHHKSHINFDLLDYNQKRTDRIFNKKKIWCQNFYKKLSYYSIITLDSFLSGVGFYVWFFLPDHLETHKNCKPFYTNSSSTIDQENIKLSATKFLGTYITLALSILTWLGLRGCIEPPLHQPHMTITIPGRAIYYLPHCSSKYHK